MKIAIIRGPMLNKAEMQSYEPLKKYFDVTAYYTNDHFSDVSIVDLPKKELRSLEGVFGMPFAKLMEYPLRVLGYRHHIIGLEKELAPFDIVHTAETYHAYSYQAVKAKEKYGTKVVVTCWENIPFFVEDTWLFWYNCRHKIKEKVRERADLFIAVTERAKEALIYEGVPEEKISVIPVGVDIDTFKPVNKDEEYLRKFGLKKDDFVVLFVGRLLWEKGVYDVLYAAKRLLSDPELKHKSLKFIFVGGEGPEESGMRKLINRLDITESVSIVGTFPYSEMPAIHNLADVFVAPSIPIRDWQEQFGMVFAEALACGKPVVSTLCGSIPEVIGDAGILVQPNDPLSIYRELKRLILDEKLRRKYGVLARERAEKVFDPEKIALRIKREYEKLI